MATLIPSLNSCLSKMTNGEKRLAGRLEAKLEADYRCGYDVPVGTRRLHPDFIILHPRRGLPILEVKDRKLDTINGMTKISATLLTERGQIEETHPLEQARQYSHEMFRVSPWPQPQTV